MTCARVDRRRCRRPRSPGDAGASGCCPTLTQPSWIGGARRGRGGGWLVGTKRGGTNTHVERGMTQPSPMLEAANRWSSLVDDDLVDGSFDDADGAGPSSSVPFGGGEQVGWGDVDEVVASIDGRSVRSGRRLVFRRAGRAGGRGPRGRGSRGRAGHRAPIGSDSPGMSGILSRRPVVTRSLPGRDHAGHRRRGCGEPDSRRQGPRLGDRAGEERHRRSRGPLDAGRRPAKSVGATPSRER